ncbi:MAG: HK97 family phage prohead protease [Spirochaetia bacterium]|nr:HK97 family phage prohead protease [Spirochaetia bacterium]
MEFKRQEIEIKAIQEGKNLFVEGYAAIFGNVDSYGDVIIPGACRVTISGAEGKRIKLCYQHNIGNVVGKIIELKEDDRGLWFKAKISNTTLGKDLVELINDEAINELSIGYNATEWDINAEQGVRYLREIKLYEISFVSRAANNEATITTTEVKQEREANEMTDEELLAKKAEIEREIESRIFNKFLKSI